MPAPAALNIKVALLRSTAELPGGTTRERKLVLVSERPPATIVGTAKRRRSAAFNFAVRHHSETADLLEKQA